MDVTNQELLLGFFLLFTYIFLLFTVEKYILEIYNSLVKMKNRILL